MRGKNIVLIGMPGAGKSTIGVILAKVLNYSFLDTDLIIQNKTGSLLFEIIENKGIEHFIEIENSIVSNIKCDNTVIATGGSVVFGADAMQNLKRNSTIVYLKLKPEEIERRVNNITTRGVVMRKDDTIYDIYRERAALYEKYSDYIVECDGFDMEVIVEKIVRIIK